MAFFKMTGQENIYQGEHLNGIANGYGIMTYSNGDRYGGQWADGKRHGYGVCTFANGEKYVGEWKDDKRNSHGVCIFQNGDKYDGEWKDNKANGHGVYTFANGDKYDGEYKDNKKNGHGIHTFANGDEYDGAYKDNKKNGHGIYTFASGGKYDGEWKDGKRNGHGVYTFTDGACYEGQWKKDKEDSYGVYTSANGRKVKKLYDNGRLISEVEITPAKTTVNYKTIPTATSKNSQTKEVSFEQILEESYKKFYNDYNNKNSNTAKIKTYTSKNINTAESVFDPAIGKVLEQIVNLIGKDGFSNGDRVCALLADIAPKLTKERRRIRFAYESGAVAKLLSALDDTDSKELYIREAVKRMIDYLDMEEDIAEDTIMILAKAVQLL
ncbi:MAG: MORN repeat-containing protein [Acutalibacteraceae bacterium]